MKYATFRYDKVEVETGLNGELKSLRTSLSNGRSPIIFSDGISKWNHVRLPAFKILNYAVSQ